MGKLRSRPTGCDDDFFSVQYEVTRVSSPARGSEVALSVLDGGPNQMGALLMRVRDNL